MKERPILFSAPMVCAILEGCKTQTRRIVKQKHLPFLENRLVSFLDGKWNQRPLPYGKVGDRLWVRETWQHSNYPLGPYQEGACSVFYRADYIDDVHGPDGEKSPEGKYRFWNPSIHMPRSASRIDLEITGVRVERLNDISERDAWAEGCEGWDDDVTGGCSGYGEFSQLWESLNGTGSWELNPWVWVIEFARLEKQP